MSGASPEYAADDLRQYPVLYVDDESANLRVFRVTFEDEFEVLCAGSGPEALEILDRRPVAILLTDDRMPGMTGVELCERARAAHPKVERLLITAFSSQRSAIDGINKAGLTRYLAKPWDAEPLREILRASILRAHLDATTESLRGVMLERERIASAAAAHVRIAHDAARMSEVVAQSCRSIERVAVMVAGCGNRGAHRLLTSAIRDLREAARFGYGLRGTVGRERASPSVRRAANLVETVARVAGDGGAPLQITADADLEVYADEVDVCRILVNLVDNARQSIAESEDGEGEVRLTATRADGRAVFTVSDTGPGVDATMRRRLFEPFVTTRASRGASGLGLAVCEVLAVANGGAVALAAAHTARGASFSLSLPMPPVDATPIPRPQ